MKKGDLRRTQILDTAEKMFYERGYEHTSVQDILDALRMSKGGFYHYFDAKDSVLRAVSERRAERRFDRLSADLYGLRRTPISRLNLLLSQANLFEAEEPQFAALMLKLCYVDGDASLNAHRRRTLIDHLMPHLGDVVAEGLADGSFHTRHPAEIGRLLLMLALDVDDEVSTMLAREKDNQDVMVRMLELLNTWRDSAEEMIGAPFGAIHLFDMGRLIEAWRTAADLCARMDR